MKNAGEMQPVRRSEPQRQKLTQSAIKKLTPPESGNLLIWDPELKGFGAKITSTGEISFILNYRNRFGHQRRWKIGNAPAWTADAARAEAAKLKVKINAEGFDPLDAKRQANSEPTFSELAKDYVECHYKEHSKSTRRNDRHMLDAILLPRLGTLRIKEIGPRHVEKIHQSLQATPYLANRVLALLSTMFKHAIESEFCVDNPTRKVKKYHEEKRERWLSAEELGRLKVALDAYPHQNTANCIRLLLLTGSRRNEALKADWSQFDLQRGVWTKPSHHTKQKKTEHVPLSAETVSLLEKMNPQESGPLFPGQKGPHIALRRCWILILSAAGLAEAVEVNGKTKWRPLVRIHDLRHTFASHLVSKGASLQIVGRLIGHTQIATTQRYAHLADGALRDATNDFGKIFSTAEAPKPDPKVVEIQKRAAGE